MEKTLVSIVILLSVLGASVQGTIISADADGFINNTDISTAFGGMTLSSVGGYAGLDGMVYAWGDGLASTGGCVFANNLSFQRQWYAGEMEGFGLRADFDIAACSVAIDIIGDDSGDYGELSAYNSAGTQIGYVMSAALDYGEVYNAIIDLGSSYEISYIIAGGADSTADTVHLDNLTATVPEPATIVFFSFAGLLLIKKT